MNSENMTEKNPISTDGAAKQPHAAARTEEVPGASVLPSIEHELRESGVTKLDVARMPSMADYVNTHYDLLPDWQHDAAHQKALEQNIYDPRDPERISLEEKYRQLKGEPPSED